MVSRMPKAMGCDRWARRSAMPMTSPAATGFRQACHRSASSVLKKWTSARTARKARRMTIVARGSDMSDGVPQEIPARGLDVGANLIGQLQRRAELLLAPDQLVEVEPHGLVVDVG